MTILVSLGEARLVDRKSKSNQIARRRREGRFILYTPHTRHCEGGVLPPEAISHQYMEIASPPKYKSGGSQ
jgi:hypothetical protein